MSNLFGTNPNQVPLNSMLGNLAFQDKAYVSVDKVGIGSTFVDSGTSGQILQVYGGGAYVSGSVGIGTTRPTSALQVIGDGNFIGVVTATSFRGDGSQLTGLVPNTVSTSSTSATQYIGFLTTNSGTTTSVLVSSSLTYIPSSSNLGIGTTNPTSRLTVVGDGNFTGVVTATSFRGDGSQLTGLVPNTISTSSTTTPQYIGFLTANSGTTTSILASSSLTYIPSSNNLGIGTTNPTSRLTVVGDGNFTGVVTATSFRGDGSSLTGINVSGAISVSTNTTNQGQYLTYSTSFGSTTGLGATTGLVFNPSSGNLGIGTTQPPATLTVNAPSGYSGNVLDLRLNNFQSAWVVPAVETASDAALWINGKNGSAAQYRNDGITYVSGSWAYITMGGGTSNSTNGIYIGVGGNAGFQIGSNIPFSFGNDVKLARDDANVLAQRNSGIGQTFRIYNTYTSASQYERAYLGWNNNVFQIGVDTAGISTARPISIVGAAGSNTGDTLQPLQINQTWTAGTGIATAITVNVTNTSSSGSSNLLDLRVNGASQFQIGNPSGSANVTRIGRQGSSAGPLNYIEFSHNVNGQAFFTNGVQSFVVLGNGVRVASGGVWFGAASDQFSGPYLLNDGDAPILAQRNGTVSQTFRVYNTYTSATNFERANVGWTTNTFIVGTEKGSAGGTARQLELQTDGTTRVAITTTGNVGIGSTQPKVKLDVIGNTLITGVTTITGTLDTTEIKSSNSLSINSRSTNPSVTSFAFLNQDTIFMQYLYGKLEIHSVVGRLGGWGSNADNLQIYGGLSQGPGVLNGGNILLDGGNSSNGGRDGDVIVGNTRGNFRVNTKVGIGTTNPISALQVIGDANISGVVTATSFYGSGLNLTDVRIGISSGGSVLGTAGTINFTGSGISTITVSSGIATINIPATTRTTSSTVAYEGQTIFPCSYTIGYVEVYFNGSRLSSTQYDASDGSNVILYEAASANDIVETVGYNGVLKLSASKTILTDVSSDGLTFYTGKAAVGIATTEASWTIRRSLFSTAGIVTSTGIARNIAWSNRTSGIYT